MSDSTDNSSARKEMLGKAKKPKAAVTEAKKAVGKSASKISKNQAQEDAGETGLSMDVMEDNMEKIEISESMDENVDGGGLVNQIGQNEEGSLARLLVDSDEEAGDQAQDPTLKDVLRMMRAMEKRTQELERRCLALEKENVVLKRDAIAMSRDVTTSKEELVKADSELNEIVKLVVDTTELKECLLAKNPQLMDGNRRRLPLDAAWRELGRYWADGKPENLEFWIKKTYGTYPTVMVKCLKWARDRQTTFAWNKSEHIASSSTKPWKRSESSAESSSSPRPREGAYKTSTETSSSSRPTDWPIPSISWGF